MSPTILLLVVFVYLIHPPLLNHRRRIVSILVLFGHAVVGKTEHRGTKLVHYYTLRYVFIGMDIFQVGYMNP